jgi:Flp pilus assembly protein TadD
VERSRAGLALGLALIYLLALLPFIKTRVGSPNDASRFGAAASLAETGAYALPPAFAGTLDRALRDDGVFISDKPPLLNVLAAGIIWAAEAVTPWRVETNLPQIYLTVTLCLSTVPAAVTVLLLGLVLASLGISAGVIGATLTLAALTTFLTPYAVTFSNHCLTAALTMGLVALLSRVERRETRPAIFFLGFLAGSLWLFDVPLGLVLLALTIIYALLHRPHRLTVFAIGLILPVIFGLVLDRALTHRWLPIYFHSDMYQYEGSAWATVPADMPIYPIRIFQRAIIMTIGAQGIFLLWPLALWALWGLRRSVRAPRLQTTPIVPQLRCGTPSPPSTAVRDGILARWVLAAWGLTLAALILNPSARGADLRGGFGYGLRWVIPLQAPLLMFLPSAIRAMRPAKRWTLALPALWGAAVVMLGVVNPWPANTVSRFPPLDNAATLLAERGAGAQTLIDAIIAWTSREPALGHFDIGMIHFRDGRARLAVEEYNRALRVAQTAPTRSFDPVLARYYLGIALSQLGLFSAANDVYAELLKQDPDNIGARNNWARCLLAWGRPRAALAQAEEAARRDPNSVSAWSLQAEAWRVLGQPGRARDALVRAQALAPNAPQVTAVLAEMASAEAR